MKIKVIIHIVVERTLALVEYAGYAVKFYIERLIKRKQFRNLKQFKNKYKGQRCFLIGNGPSLNIEDVQKLKNEKTFVVNAFVKAMDEISFKPTFYGIIDGECMDLFGDAILECGIENIFFTKRHLKKQHYKQLQAINAYEYPQMQTGKRIYCFSNIPSDFSEDITKNVYWGYTVVYSMLQIINYMGFKDVYLLGMDCAYKPGEKCFKDHRSAEQISKGMYAGKNGAVDKFIVAYEKVKEYSLRHEMNIYNATRGGMLEVFQRVDLDEVLRENELGK